MSLFIQIYDLVIFVLFPEHLAKLTRIELWDLNVHFNQVINWI